MEVGNITSAEGMLMLATAVLFDGTMLLIGVAGDWWGFSDYGTIGWLGWAFFGTWSMFRNMSLNPAKKSEGDKTENNGEKKEDAKEEKLEGKEESDQERLKRLDAKYSPEQVSKFEKRRAEGIAAQKKDTSSKKKSPSSSKTSMIMQAVKDPMGALMSFVKRYGWGFIVKGIPILGDFWPGFTIFVWRELKRG